MVLEFGLLKSSLFPESELTGVGLGADLQQVVINPTLADDSFFTFIYDSGAATEGHLLCHSATNWCSPNGTATRVTSNAGVTWADATTDGISVVFCARSRGATPAKGIAGNINEAEVMKYTTNSGVNWTTASTNPVTTDNVEALDFVTDDVAVIGVANGLSARGIYRSTNGGIDWTMCATGPVEVAVISMFSATIGYAVDLLGNIWKTTDGGVNWTDTTHNVASPPGLGPMKSTMLAITATTCIIANNVLRMEYYDNTAGTVTVKLLTPVSTTPAAGTLHSNFKKVTNGNIYHVKQQCFETGLVIGHLLVYRSVDAGVTWTVRILPTPALDLSGGTGTLMACTTLLDEIGNTNELLFHAGRGCFIKFAG